MVGGCGAAGRRRREVAAAGRLPCPLGRSFRRYRLLRDCLALPACRADRSALLLPPLRPLRPQARRCDR